MSSFTPRCCFKCGAPFGGLHCRQCTCDRCRRKFMVEVCSLCCGEDGKLFDNCPNPTHFKDFYNSLQQPQTHSAESFNDNPNFGYTPQEPFVYNQDPSEIFSQSPPQIDQRYCYGCGDPLDDLFCQRCTCESCGNDAHYGYDCPPQVSFIYNPEPCYNQDFDNDFPQSFQSYPQQYLCCENCGGPHETFQCQPLNQNFYEPNLCYNSNSSGFDQYQPQQYTIIHQPPQETSVQAREDLMKSIQTFLKKFNRISFRETPKVLLLAWEKFFEIKHAFKEKQHQPEDIQELLRKLLKDVQIISEKLADYINTPNWNCPAFYDNDDEDDDEEYTIAITPVLPNVEPNNSLSMGGEHLSTIPEKKESSVEDLVLRTLSQSQVSPRIFPISKVSVIDDESFSDEDVPKEIYSNPLFDEEIISTKIDPHHFNAESDLIESLLNQDTSIISSPKIDSLLEEFSGELAHIDLIPPGINETDFDPEEEIHLVEKLLYDNSSPRPPEELNPEVSDAVIESFSPSPIPVEDSDFLMEEIDLFLTPDDSMPPGIENDDYDSEGDILFLEELLSNDSPSLPENESFHFDVPSSPRPPAKPPDDGIYFEPDTGLLTAKVVGDISKHYVLMPRLLPTQPTLCPVIDTLLPFSSENEDKVHLLSHRGFKAFQLFSESPMMIYGGNIPILDVPFLHFYPP
ncbi:hypothetical protein Tco_0838894 [Tanacetum coccineum]|uniref:CCHC-type domain-containing protein n=1 Tax=Tanacetum coccineum TaxID=301880 RepID=A0ABQ5ARY6_9ASTR